MLLKLYKVPVVSTFKGKPGLPIDHKLNWFIKFSFIQKALTFVTKRHANGFIDRKITAFTDREQERQRETYIVLMIPENVGWRLWAKSY